MPRAVSLGLLLTETRRPSDDLMPVVPNQIDLPCACALSLRIGHLPVAALVNLSRTKIKSSQLPAGTIYSY
jgi:hypothetical protein